MRVPFVRGVIERRILVNYRVDPAALAGALPAPFRPVLVDGAAIAGICLIRLAEVRPPPVPAVLGLRSENAAHRIAVEWEESGERREGVYIPRRDTSSRLSTVFGGRLFPGLHRLARFEVGEGGGRYRIAMDSEDDATHVLLDGTVTPSLSAGSVFGSLAAASAFFRRGAVGYSATMHPDRFDGLELRSLSWRMEPLAVTAAESSFFDDRRRFPAGSVEFDCALLMRDIAHEWHARDELRRPPARPSPGSECQSCGGSERQEAQRIPPGSGPRALR